jgi:hypothetical protein
MQQLTEQNATYDVTPSTMFEIRLGAFSKIVCLSRAWLSRASLASATTHEPPSIAGRRLTV